MPTFIQKYEGEVSLRRRAAFFFFLRNIVYLYLHQILRTVHVMLLGINITSTYDVLHMS